MADLEPYCDVCGKETRRMMAFELAGDFKIICPDCEASIAKHVVGLRVNTEYERRLDEACKVLGGLAWFMLGISIFLICYVAYTFWSEIL